MYSRKVYQALLLVFFVCISCTKDDPFNLALRNGENDTYYWENNKLAAMRFSQIMYNKTDSAHPSERFKIIHISDPHLSFWSKSNNQALPINLNQSVRFANQQELRINALVATGDYISNGKKDEAIRSLQSFISYFYQNNRIPSFFCTGNHDSNALEDNPSAFINRAEINSVLFNRYWATSQSNYSYADVPNPQGGVIRFISLDMLDQPGSQYNTMRYACFSQEQINWLGNVALKKDMTNTHSVVILTHYPFQRYSPNAETYLCDGDFVNAWNMIPEIIEAFRSRSPINKNYPNQLSPETPPIIASFDFQNTPGEFICYLGGHAHCNALFNVIGIGNTNPNLPKQHMILCTNQAPSEIGTVYNRIVRKEDSLSSNSFCIYAIDTKEKKVYITFFGAYKPSNNPTYEDIQSFSYL